MDSVACVHIHMLSDTVLGDYEQRSPVNDCITIHLQMNTSPRQLHQSDFVTPPS